MFNIKRALTDQCEKISILVEKLAKRQNMTIHGESEVNMNKGNNGNKNSCKLKQDSMFQLSVLSPVEKY